ncbi:MAG: hypothetical protein HF962_04835 [Sulfurovum sp.]|nr:hypothetical protein [Sulfurovum sp.]
MPKLLSIAFVLLFVACAPRIDLSVIPTQQKKLYSALLRSSHQIDHREAEIVSREAILYSRKLAAKYQVSTPPLFHNFLVNIRAKERGLCYQWSDDLYGHLKHFNFQTIQIKPVGSNIGSYWTEHNALVVLPKGNSDLRQGVLLDPWRKSGELYFVPILRDLEYQWSIRVDRNEVYQNGK